MKKYLIIILCLLAFTPFNKAKAQHEIRIQGVVREVTSQDPLAGIIVLLDGNRVAVTDIDGKFAAFVPNNAELLFYSPDYNDYKLNVDNRQIINVAMTMKILELQETIVVGQMSKKTIVVDQTELEVIGNYFHLKTKFRVPKQIFTAEKRFIVQPTLVNVTKEHNDYFRPVVIDGRVYTINRQRISGYRDSSDVLACYIEKNNLAKTDHIYVYHDSVFISREYFNDDFKAECYLAVNANYEDKNKDYLDTVTIARGTQNPLRFFDYGDISPIELNDTSLIPKPEMKLVADEGVSKIGFVIGKAQLDKNDPQNEIEMNTIKDKLMKIIENRFSTLNSISVIGYASPDGNYRNNAILAQKRTDVVLAEIVNSLPESVRSSLKMSSMSVVEPWSRVAKLMKDDSLALADDVQRIVDKYRDDYVNTQSAIRRLPNYRNTIAAEYLPKLRRVEYVINSTEFRNLTIPEIWERYRNGEEDISRYEFWKMIESCEDSLQKVQMEREALKHYPNFVLIANREAIRLIDSDSVDFSVLEPSIDPYAPYQVKYNQALMALSDGDIDMADSLLRFVPTNQSTTHLKAVVNTLTGNYDAAYPYLASKGGLNEVLILLCMGRNKDADAKISAILEDQANWGNAVVWYIKSVCANRLDDLNYAIDAMMQAITIDPRLEDIARLDSDVMDIIEIIAPKEEGGTVE